MQKKMDHSDAEAARERQRLDAQSEKTDHRVSDLVRSIGELVRRMPPQS